MPRKFLKAQEQSVSHGQTLPTHLPVILYYRQSSMAQVGNLSTFMQTVDMPLYLQKVGWHESQIILIDADAGVSGTRKIADRVGLSEAFDLILNNQVGAIAAQDEDRFFRDASMIQANIFIEACREHNVMVITTSTIYDFAHPQYGQFHIKQFRLRCESAADYIIHHIRGRLAAARMRRRNEGRWSGGFMPAGYMVKEDTREFAVFEDYASIVRHYYDRALALNGNTTRLYCEVVESGPWYPQVAAPPGHKIQYQLKAYYANKGYNRRAWEEFLTNPVYIGHWVVKGTVKLYNNHAAIIDEDTFSRVFNLLSDTKLNGDENEAYTPRRTYTVKSTKRERPLMDGMLWSLEGAEWRQVGCDWNNDPRGYWDYCLRDRKTARLIWKRQAASIDAAIEQMVVAKLRVTFQEQDWESAVKQYWKQYERSRKIIEAELAGIDETLASLVMSLALVKNPKMVADVERRYEEAQAFNEAKEKELQDEYARAKGIDDMQRMKEDFAPAIDNWPNLSRDRKNTVITAFIGYIHVEPEGHDTAIKIVWRDESEDVQIVKRIWGEHSWTKEDEEILRDLLGEDQLTIAAALPEFTWRRIYSKASYWGTRLKGGMGLDFDECYYEYCQRLGIETSIRLSSVFVPPLNLLPLALHGILRGEPHRDGLVHLQVL